MRIHPRYETELAKQQELLGRPNEVDTSFYNGIYDRYRNPVLTREHIPLFWRYDLDMDRNPHFQERLGVNAVMNSGAIELDGKFYLVARVEGNDRKSFFAVAESQSPVEGFRFWDYPVVLPDTCPEETNVYDMRLTKHQDGYIYGVFCSESKDRSVSDLSAAVAAAGIVRTKDLKTWERLPNLKTLQSPQQRNVVLHPEFVEGRYAFYTRPMDDFIDTGSGGGIGFGLCRDILHPVIDEERITSKRQYHTITEAKNGAGAVPVRTPQGWIHIAHGVVLGELHHLEPGGGIRQTAVCRNQIHAAFRMEDGPLQVKFQILRVVDGDQQQVRQGAGLFRRGVAQGGGEVALRVVVNHQYLHAREVECSPQIQRTGGLTNSTFLIGQ